MKMTLSALAAAMVMMVTSMPADAQVNHRQWRQDQRIERGYSNGRLTPREARRLDAQQRRIDRYEYRSRRDRGGLSRYERARIDRKQDRASRNIWRKKHNYRGY